MCFSLAHWNSHSGYDENELNAQNPFEIPAIPERRNFLGDHPPWSHQSERSKRNRRAHVHSHTESFLLSIHDSLALFWKPTFLLRSHMDDNRGRLGGRQEAGWRSQAPPCPLPRFTSLPHPDTSFPHLVTLSYPNFYLGEPVAYPLCISMETIIFKFQNQSLCCQVLFFLNNNDNSCLLLL